MKLLPDPVEYPCIIGTKHSMLRARSNKDIRHFIKGYKSDSKVLIKDGFTPSMQVKFIIEGSGKFSEFKAFQIHRKWCKPIAFFYDFSILECDVSNYGNLNTSNLVKKIKDNVSSYDRHFPLAMKVYKHLHSIPGENIFNREAFNLLWLKLGGNGK